ncbi:MAG: DNA-methyltransferase [Promethearchaeota archaeon]
MKTYHKIFFSNSSNMKEILSESVDLVVTSPPYPIIELWDELFAGINPEIQKALAAHDGLLVFELMHKELDRVWREVYRVLKKGGIVAINIGDAVRTIGNNFMLYPNHSRVLNYFLDLGFSSLPVIIWHKPTNAPNKFMGSGMLPPGAYVTLEHEYILILRKGGKREFNEFQEKMIRQKSSYFWEERNTWFSDQWYMKGMPQNLDVGTRDRSAAFPFELPYRLINMFSIKYDLILDPFLGTGTTTLAAMTSGRNSIGFELDAKLEEIIFQRINNIQKLANQYLAERLRRHEIFVQERLAKGKPLKHINNVHNFPVITKQEEYLTFDFLRAVYPKENNHFEVIYEEKV